MRHQRPWYKSARISQRCYYRLKPHGKALIRWPPTTVEQAREARWLLAQFWWYSARDAAEAVGLLGPIPPKFRAPAGAAAK